MFDAIRRWLRLDVPQMFGARSPGWSSCQRAHLQREPDCQFCGTRKGLQVHHVVPVGVDPERELDPENLITLCGPSGPHNCHLLVGHLGNYQRHNPHVREDCRAWRERRKQAARLTEAGGSEKY